MRSIKVNALGTVVAQPDLLPFNIQLCRVVDVLEVGGG